MLALRVVRPAAAKFEVCTWNLLVQSPRHYTTSNHQPKKDASSLPPMAPPSTVPPPAKADQAPTKPCDSLPKAKEDSATNLAPGGTGKTGSGSAAKKLSTQKVRENVQDYVLPRYFDYVKNYDKVLEKNFPSAVKVYRVFFDGLKDFYADMKRYLKISRIINESPKGLRALNRQELELYMQMPRDMVKVAPTLVLSSLPMVGYAIFPLVFMYPRRFLTSHFWSLQQRSEFQQMALKERLAFNRPVLRSLQAKLPSSGEHALHRDLSEALGLLGSGFHPSMEDMQKFKDIFTVAPYNLHSLTGKHIKMLCQMHGIPGSWFRRHRLTEHAYLVHHMDLAIGREGGVHNMQPEAIRQSCYIRGLNPSNLSNDEMIAWLRNWITLSTTMQEQHITFFLHLPLFLAYNHPNNWQLIYGCDKQQQPPK